MPTLTTQMKSVGEVMAIGRSFTESLGKALRSLETGTPVALSYMIDKKPLSTMNEVTIKEIKKEREDTDRGQDIFYSALFLSSRCARLTRYIRALLTLTRGFSVG